MPELTKEDPKKDQEKKDREDPTTQELDRESARSKERSK